MHTKLNTFRQYVLASVLLIYLVIAAGGIVRSTGSGMGCPDWPKCFGTWIPPTDVSQLPANYKEVFKVGHKHIADFNVFKTWIEYINRLLGVLVGISVFITALYSFFFLNSKRKLVYLSFLIVFLTGVQGYIGAKVVSSNLSEYMITIHMLIAMVIMSLALYLLALCRNSSDFKAGINGNTILFLSLLTLLQILIGTQVRQGVDSVSVLYQEAQRQLWINKLGSMYYFHRVVAVIVVVVNIWFVARLLKFTGVNNTQGKLLLLTVIVLILEYVFGVIMAKFSIPAFAQPVHLLLATILFGLQFYSWLISKLQVQKPVTTLAV